MKRTILGSLGLLLVMLPGCAVFDKGRLDPRVASQVMVSKLDPAPGCEYLGAVKGSAFADLSDAHGDVLRNAVLRGGNYVAVDLVEKPAVFGVGPYVVRGRLFACPVRPPVMAMMPPAPPPAPPAPVVGAATPKPCEPDCAAGFTCQLGACVATPTPQAAAPTTN